MSAIACVVLGGGAHRRQGFVQLRRALRRLVHHGVGVIDPHSVGAGMLAYDGHHRVVRVFARPVALPFEHHRLPGHRHDASLNHALHRVVVSIFRRATGGVGDHVDLVAALEHRGQREGDVAHLGPQAGNNHLVAPGGLERVAYKAAGRNKVIVSGLWTEVCNVTFALSAMLEGGYEVYMVADASGGTSKDAHDYAMQRMIQAGVVPMTWQPVVLEWQRDWARKDTYDPVMAIVREHSGAYGMGVDYAYTMVHKAPQRTSKLHEALAPVRAA